MNRSLSRREFVAGSVAAGTLLAGRPALSAAGPKLRVALVGTGIRGIGFRGEYLSANYADVLEYAALCDVNPGRVELARTRIDAACPVFTDFDEMLEKSDIDVLIVCTVDSTHDEFIVRGLERGLDVVAYSMRRAVRRAV